MVNKLKDYWFEILFFGLVILCSLFLVIVVCAPHHDEDMRGFVPCTYELSLNLGKVGQKSDISEVFSAVVESYICYAGVMQEGVKLWLDGKQNTPWANYFFTPVDYTIPNELSEPFSDDLLKANRLDDENDVFDTSDE